MLGVNFTVYKGTNRARFSQRTSIESQDSGIKQRSHSFLYSVRVPPGVSSTEILRLRLSFAKICCITTATAATATARKGEGCRGRSEATVLYATGESQPRGRGEMGGNEGARGTVGREMPINESAKPRSGRRSRVV